jgi:hypothetical protein
MAQLAMAIKVPLNFMLTRSTSTMHRRHCNAWSGTWEKWGKIPVVHVLWWIR